MRKLLFVTSAAILALFVVGCDSLPFLGGAGEEEATPESSPSPTAEATASPTPSPTPFASPDVPQKPPGAPALIQSSNPDERVSRLEQEVGGQAPPPTTDTTQGRDPFSPGNIPIPPPPESDGPTAGGTSIEGPVVVTQLPSQQVPQLPSIPEIAAPPQLGGPQPSPLPPGRPDAARPGTPDGIRRRPGDQVPDLASGQVPELPQIGELTRPPQVGGTRLAGDVPPIRLSSLAERVVNEFRTFQALLDDTTTYSDYSTDLGILSITLRGETGGRSSTRRQFLLTNRSLYRRLEKVLQEYVFARRLWDTYYSESDDPDTVRCSSIPAIERAISVYQVETEQRGQLLCATRINLLGSIWDRANNILEAALRDSDFIGPSLADIPSLPDAGEPQQLAELPQVPEFERPATGTPSLPDGGEPQRLAQLPVVPPFEAPSQPRSIGLGPGPVEPMPEIPSIAIEPRGVPDLPELPVQDPPPRDPSARPEPRSGGQEPSQPASPPPPPPPSTDLAEGVKITGVVQVGNEKQIIIEAPGEATSRYVKVGQRVAGGKVLVKRVDFENGEAIVILEENDVEIRKTVGQQGVVE